MPAERYAARPEWPLQCPRCGGTLGADWRCAGCGRAWTALRGLPALYDETAVAGTDRLMRRFYDGLPSLHDPLTRHLLPRLQLGASEEALRSGYLDRMDLGAFGQGIGGRRPRILEVGIGTGVNLPRVLDRLPRGLEVDYWGLDLSRGMLARCQRRPAPPAAALRLVMGDVHALPFASDSMDLVFHVGAMGSFRDPAKALAELVRVARPGAPVVVVDEQLDPALPRTLRTRVAFFLLTFYDDAPGAPLAHLPPGVEAVRVAQITPFYYCLTFAKAPEGAGPSRMISAP